MSAWTVTLDGDTVVLAETRRDEEGEWQVVTRLREWSGLHRHIGLLDLPAAVWVEVAEVAEAAGLHRLAELARR